MARELITIQANIFDNTIQDQLEEWRSAVWRKVYLFAKSSVGMAFKSDKYVECMCTYT